MNTGFDIFNYDPRALIPSTVVYHDSTGCQHTLCLRAHINPDRFVNADQVDWDGANNLVVEVDNTDGDNPRIIQVGGYTNQRGMFVDQY